MFILKKCFGRYPVFLGNGGILGLTKGEHKFRRRKNFSLEAAKVASQSEN